MTAQSRDTQILEKIQGYCNDIMFTHTEYAHITPSAQIRPIATRLRSA